MTLRTTSWSPPALAMGIALLTAAAVYWPGLSGGFLFDDFVNLDALGRYGGVRDWRSFWLYLTSGDGDPTGRPLSMLSFLLDGRDWPADPLPFKRTNLLIHLVNGALLFIVLCRLGERAGLDEARSDRAAVLATALWLLHPLWVSTTLYVVQRQAMLPLAFALIAMFSWEAGWRRLERGQPLPAWLFGFGGVGLASACAFLSKANGALTPVLVALAWWLLYRPQPSSRHSGESRNPLGEAKWTPASAGMTDSGRPLRHALPEAMRHHARSLARWALLLPSTLVAVALLAQIPDAIRSAAEVRPWSFGERLLSQPRALIDYLGLLWLPREGSAGLEADHFALSASLLEPWTTLPGLLAAVGLIALALWQRRRQPVLALALLFFFVGHSVESSVIPLEPYFEHRNYLPAALLFWPLAVWLTDVRRLSTLKRVLWLALPLLLAAITFMRAELWGDPARLHAASVAHSPESPRALLNLALAEINGGRWSDGHARLRRLVAAHPDSAVAAFNLIDAECSTGTVSVESLAAARHALTLEPTWRPVLPRWLGGRVDGLAGGAAASRCAGLGMDAIEGLLDAAEGNPRIQDKPGWRQDVYSLRGQLTLIDGQPDVALTWFNTALRLEPNPDSALWQAARLANFGHPKLGLRHLQQYRDCCWGQHRPASGMARLHQQLKWRSGFYDKEFAHLEAALREDSLSTEQGAAGTARR